MARYINKTGSCQKLWLHCFSCLCNRGRPNKTLQSDQKGQTWYDILYKTWLFRSGRKADINFPQAQAEINNLKNTSCRYIQLFSEENAEIFRPGNFATLPLPKPFNRLPENLHSGLCQSIFWTILEITISMRILASFE